MNFLIEINEPKALELFNEHLERDRGNAKKEPLKVRRDTLKALCIISSSIYICMT
jgi:hypothetical protein